MVLTNDQFYLIIGIWSLTLIRSILIMFGGNVFKDANMSEKSAKIPIINLYSMLDVIDVPSYFGILFFIPFFNFIPLFIMSYKLGIKYNCNFGFRLGLIFLSLIFYPMLFKKHIVYNEQYNDTFSTLDSTKSENIDLINKEENENITNEEVNYELDSSVDSIFKSKFEAMDPVESYRASKIDKDVLEKISKLNNNYEFSDDFEPIERIDEENDNKNLSINHDTNKFTSDTQEEKNVEFIDL